MMRERLARGIETAGIVIAVIAAIGALVCIVDLAVSLSGAPIAAAGMGTIWLMVSFGMLNRRLNRLEDKLGRLADRVSDTRSRLDELDRAGERILERIHLAFGNDN